MVVQIQCSQKLYFVKQNIRKISNTAKLRTMLKPSDSSRDLCEDVEIRTSLNRCWYTCNKLGAVKGVTRHDFLQDWTSREDKREERREKERKERKKGEDKEDPSQNTDKLTWYEEKMY